jgi:hypothetical protein
MLRFGELGLELSEPTLGTAGNWATAEQAGTAVAERQA